jgi:hypothetical protein
VSDVWNDFGIIFMLYLYFDRFTSCKSSSTYPNLSIISYWKSNYYLMWDRLIICPSIWSCTDIDVFCTVIMSCNIEVDNCCGSSASTSLMNALLVDNGNSVPRDVKITTRMVVLLFNIGLLPLY